MLLSAYYSYTGDTKGALEHLRLFGQEDNYQYWSLLFDNDPTLEPIKDQPEVKSIMKSVETKFWKQHEKLKNDLEEKGLL